MFGALYTRALELFGRALLLSSFVPCLVVTSGVYLSVDTGGFLALLDSWAAETLDVKASRALLLLVGIYLFAYVLYGLRDAATELLRSGRLWVLPSVRAARRRHFLRARLARQESFDVSLGIPQAAVWAEAGFGAPDPASVVFQKDVSADRLLERAKHRLERLGEAKARGGMDRVLTVGEGEDLAQLLWALHQLSDRKPAAVAPLVEQLGAMATDEVLTDWYRAIQHRSYGALVDAFQPMHAEPAERDIQPTALGNVLACGASYSRVRYGIQAPLLHPRLAQVVDKDYQAKLDDARTFFDFAVLATFLCAMAGLFVAVWSAWPPRTLSPGRALVALGWFGASHLFYRVTVAGARTYALALNSAIDLFRLKLLDALAVAAPADVAAEREVWRELDGSFLDGTPPRVTLKTATPLTARME